MAILSSLDTPNLHLINTAVKISDRFELEHVKEGGFTNRGLQRLANQNIILRKPL